MCEVLQNPRYSGLSFFTFWLTNISSSPSLYCSGRFCFTCRRLVRCSKSCLSITSCSLFVISLCLIRPMICLDYSSSFRSFLSFSALWASLPRVLRICRTSRLRKQTYGSASSVSAPVSNLNGRQWRFKTDESRAAYLEASDQQPITSCKSPAFPMLINLSGKDPCMVINVFVKTDFHFFVCKNGRTIYCCVRLLYLCRFFEKIHDFFELILGALGRCFLFLVQKFEEDVIFLIHIIRTSATVFYSGRKANKCRRLSIEQRVQSIIVDGTLNCLWGWNIDLSNFTTYSCCLGGR